MNFPGSASSDSEISARGAEGHERRIHSARMGRIGFDEEIKILRSARLCMK